jgi:hypothetical protein
MCDEMQKCTLSASMGKHRVYGTLYRKVLHDIPMEAEAITQMIDGLLA